MATRDRWKFIFSWPHRRKKLIAAIIGWDKASICFKIAAIDFDPEVLMDSCRSVGFKCYAANLLPQTAAAKGGIQRSAQILELQMALFHFVGNKITEIPLWHRYFLSSKHQNHKLPMFILKVPPRFLLPICPVKNFHPPKSSKSLGPLNFAMMQPVWWRTSPPRRMRKAWMWIDNIKTCQPVGIFKLCSPGGVFFFDIFFFFEIISPKIGEDD